MAEGGERQPGQVLFRAVGAARHQLLAADLDQKAIASLVEDQLLAVGRGDIVENAPGLHGELRAVTAKLAFTTGRRDPGSLQAPISANAAASVPLPSSDRSVASPAAL